MSLYNQQSFFLQQPSIFTLLHLYSTLSAKRIDSVCLFSPSTQSNTTTPLSFYYAFSATFVGGWNRVRVSQPIQSGRHANASHKLGATRRKRTFEKDFWTASRMLTGNQTHVDTSIKVLSCRLFWSTYEVACNWLSSSPSLLRSQSLFIK